MLQKGQKTSSANLAEVYESEKQFNAAERELETAIANEPDPELRARLLIDLLRVELSAGNDAKAEAVFNKARQIADENGLTDVICRYSHSRRRP